MLQALNQLDARDYSGARRSVEELRAKFSARRQPALFSSVIQLEEDLHDYGFFVFNRWDALAASLAGLEWAGGAPPHPGWVLAGDATAAALLGTATTAMLLGHSYLIAPAMSIAPLVRLLAALAVATLLRAAVAAAGLWSWTETHSLTNLNDVTVLWLPVRWGLGLVGPLVLAWLAWQTARIRSTQSATGILYVVVIFCFLGELTAQLLWTDTGFVL